MDNLEYKIYKINKRCVNITILEGVDNDSQFKS